MKEELRRIQPWIEFAGLVLIVTVLYWGQAILVPLALATLLTFLLAPMVSALQRWIGRVPAVLGVVVLISALLGLVGWVFARQMASLAQELPAYRHNIRQKIADIRGAGKGTSVEKVQETITDIKEEMAKAETGRGTPARPVVVTSEQTQNLWSFSTWLGPLLEPLGTAAFVFVLVIFMLLERQDLRNRLISVIGHGQLAITTRAFEEAETRVSKYLMMQSLVNLIFGALAGIGLHLIGVPYALLWASLAAMLRFIPYVGPWIGAALPIILSLAISPGWAQPLYVLGLFLCLELFTNFILETFLYAGAAGVSQVGLVVAVAFWAWLWGPLGLLMATPLTVCLVVLGKHLPGLEFLSTLMADRPALAPDVAFYQRLVARDQSEASELLEEYLKGETPAAIFDDLLLPALNYAERDRLEGRLSPEDEAMIVGSIRELTNDVTARLDPRVSLEPSLPVFAYPSNGVADEMALQMLSTLTRGAPLSIDVASSAMIASEVVGAVRERQARVVLIADLPPSAPSKTRYLVKKLRAAIPDLLIIVGRWAPSGLADTNDDGLVPTGANHVSSRLQETADHLRQIAQQLSPSSAGAESARKVPVLVK